ncbi:MAG: cation:proton antiporter, partial [Clostridia bacterium]|nr:cation:proton antiporter [Clostridia bacterium]
SFLYFFFPEFMSGIFQGYAEEGKVLNIFYQLGLIFLMFLSGYNTDIKVDKSNAKTVSLVFVGATVLPMAGSIPFFQIFEKYFIGSINNSFSFRLVFAIGVAITSIPVISKIFFDMGIMNTRFSNTVLTISTFQDLCLWILLNVATRTAATGEIRLGEMIVVVAVTIGLFVVITLVAKYMKAIKKTVATNVFYTLSFVSLLLVCALLYKAGVNIMYSAFLVGYVVKSLFSNEEESKKAMKYLEKFVFSFFVPIYFALVGIQLNVIHDFSPARFLLFFVIAFGLEFAGTWFMLIFSKLSSKTKINFAVTMNARGGPGIVLATVAYSANIISVEFFTVLILTTMLSSMIAGYWLRWQQKKDENVFNEEY